jgi:anti-sigma B factor antagonist
MEMPMRIDQHVRRGVVFIEPKESLTEDTEGAFRQQIRSLLEAGQSRLVVDLAEVPYLDSTGVGALAYTHVAALRRNGKLMLLNVTGRNRRVLTITRLLGVFDVCETEEDAARGFDADTTHSMGS